MSGGELDPLNLPPESVTPGQIYMAMQAMNGRMAAIATEQVRTREELEQLQTSTKDMLRAWQAGGALLKFIKVMGAIAMAFGSIVGLVALVRGVPWK